MKAAVSASPTSHNVATTAREPAARKAPVREARAWLSSPVPRAVRQAASTVRSARSSSPAISPPGPLVNHRVSGEVDHPRPPGDGFAEGALRGPLAGELDARAAQEPGHGA